MRIYAETIRSSATDDADPRVTVLLSKRGTIKSATVRVNPQEVGIAWTVAKMLRMLGKIDDDPVAFAVRDRWSYLLGLGLALGFGLAVFA